ncbi:cysteine desulfurase sulfur acceptor subunit CsdE [Budviciaceae bacterium BWR-B9]|uniref:Cysteine desulfurase sulfur acceptor subunit CsdE n=1 Tax=Limnobaculum allomyrinae TaxID=2791986 RepID=A0ABS1IS72_9GAMM|nr:MULTISPECIES: cysteine desulfurase sulfur acceptor subunit CsdE [Limnobaculum]MBK5144618.1 cysteine desulfurase sulfur acceptor subunit CsdE [Limnobaculum allomyrinae]MBV7692151.1 cysteine desulfurase sulfur acceptor subunit CsdE [Limnobaculum sp. M2-1]
MMLAPHPFGTDIGTEQLLSLFSDKKQWEDRYRQLIQLSKQLPPLPEALKQQQLELKGCENRVWLGHQRNEDGTLHFYGDSEGRIVKGILAILLAQIEGQTPQHIVKLDLMQLFDRLGIHQQLSASRSQGLDSLVNTIEKIALLYI